MILAHERREKRKEMGEKNLKNELMEIVKRLSSNHRGSCTENERKAAEFIAKKISEIGLTPKIKTFRCPPSFSYPYAFLFLVSGILVLKPHFLSFTLLLILFLTYILENLSFSVVSRLFPFGKSQNVFAELGEGDRVVISAHIDSAKTSLIFKEPFVKYFRVSFLSISGVFGISPFVVLISIFHDIMVLRVVLSTLFFISGLALILGEKNKFTFGANDNASGVSVLLLLMKILKEKEKEGRMKINKRIIFLFSGAEESGLNGMINFLKEKPGRGTVFLNVDNVGKGHLIYTTKEGMLISLKTPKRLRDLIESISKELKIDVKGEPQSFMSTDALVPLSRGYEAISFMAHERGLLGTNWHTEKDVFQNVDFDLLEKSVIVLERVLEEL